MSNSVTEFDFRKPEFLHAKVEDYEFREDGKIVRKDRFRRAIFDIVYILGMNSFDFETIDVTNAVYGLVNQYPNRLLDDELDL
jgi:hypothetical protein